MRSGKKSQNVFLIKCQNLPHSESNWEPEQNIFLKEINLFYFKESSVKRTHYDTMFNLIDEITIQSKNTSRLGNILKFRIGMVYFNRNVDICKFSNNCRL